MREKLLHPGLVAALLLLAAGVVATLGLGTDDPAERAAGAEEPPEAPATAPGRTDRAVGRGLPGGRGPVVEPPAADAPPRAAEPSGAAPPSPGEPPSAGAVGLGADAGASADGMRASGGTWHRKRSAEDGPAEAPATADAGGGEPGWQDPVNQQVLGPRRWMAEPSAELEQQIAEGQSGPKPEPFPLRPATRQRSIEAAKLAVANCFAELRARRPNAAGRISVSWWLVADGDTARLDQVAVEANVDLRDPTFTDCVPRQIDRLSIGVDGEDGALLVEYPFFLGGG